MKGRGRPPRELEAIPDHDAIDGVPVPRESFGPIHGHAAVEDTFLNAIHDGRLHHAWLLCGPQGIGKATMAYRVARYLLNANEGTLPDPRPSTLDTPTHSPATSLITAQAHPDFVVLRREVSGDRGTVDAAIRKERVSAAVSLMQSTAAYGGWRIVLIDSIDDLNRSSANALLKIIEEPPPQALFLMVSHGTRAILPTIRSRCRRLQFSPLPTPTVAAITQGFGAPFAQMPADAHLEAARRGEGSVGKALSFLNPATAQFRGKVERILDGLPTLGPADAQEIAELVNGKTLQRPLDVFVDVLQSHLYGSVHRLAAAGDIQMLAARAELWDKLAKSAREVDIFNLDRRPFVLSALADCAALERRANG
jgi:DNA polymerase-3 subunit delta'